MDTLKVPPHSMEAEQSVVGGLMLENTAWDRIADLISDSDFYRADHRLIYRHISRLIEHNKPADVVTVAESLDSTKELATVGGIRLPECARQQHPVCRQHPPLCGNRARALDPASARGSGHRNRGLRVQHDSARKRTRCSTRPSPRCSRSRSRARAGARVFRRCRRCSPRSSSASTCSTTAKATTLPACRPVSSTSIA